MAPDEENNNNLYACWLNDELSEEEKKLLEENGDAKLLREIISTIDEWKLPELKPGSFEKIREKITAKKQEAKILPLYKKTWVLTLAAMLIITFGLTWLFLRENSGEVQLTELTSGPGEIKTFSLPDNTSLTLYGKSKISYDARTFSKNRFVYLSGEGYFEVNKPGNFIVDYTKGTVRVLGTKFDILEGEDISSVKCFEGKVEVKVEKETVTLQPGEGVRRIENKKMTNFKFENSASPQANTENKFENVPLREVCAALSLYYDVKIKSENIDAERNFTGRFSKSNLDSALTMVFDPMGISFRKEGKTVSLYNK